MKISRPIKCRSAQSSGLEVNHAFTPLNIVGNINWMHNLASSKDYAWTPIHKLSSTSTDQSLSEENLNESELLDEFVKKPSGVVAPYECAIGHNIGLEESKVIGKPELQSFDLMKEFENQFPFNKPKSVADSKLAVRSDVVNKTLLRSLKRYYTAKFEHETGFKNLSKEQQKANVKQIVRDFAISVYKDDERFQLEEFKDVDLEGLILYMSI